MHINDSNTLTLSKVILEITESLEAKIEDVLNEYIRVWKDQSVYISFQRSDSKGNLYFEGAIQHFPQDPDDELFYKLIQEDIEVIIDLEDMQLGIYWMFSLNIPTHYNWAYMFQIPYSCVVELD